MRLIEPLILVIIAGVIGFVAVGLLYPIFTMSQTLKVKAPQIRYGRCFLTNLFAFALLRPATILTDEDELIGQGIGNMMSALVGGLPGAGATMRTVVNINSGGKTRLSGFIHGLVLVTILLGLGK